MPDHSLASPPSEALDPKNLVITMAMVGVGILATSGAKWLRDRQFQKYRDRYAHQLEFASSDDVASFFVLWLTLLQCYQIIPECRQTL